MSKKEPTLSTAKKNKATAKKSKKKATKRASSTPQRGARSRAQTANGGLMARARSAVWVAFKMIFWRALLACSVIFFGYVVYLDIQIREQFEGQKWALPAHVYTRPLELYLGQRFAPDLVASELQELGYQAQSSVERVGTYRLNSLELAIHQRAFRFWDEARPAQIIKVAVRDGFIARIDIEQPDGQRQETEIVRLEPRLFGSVTPMQHEDRALVRLDDVPQALIDGLLAYEDRQFYSHWGVNPKGLARTFVQLVTTGRPRGGGSSLTQQLVKNYYLTSERTVRRKVVEMIMAVLLEVHYDKDEILQAYINEVNLAQSGNRAIHGFGLASRYYYGRPLNELTLSELATLVAINNAPSRYNPLKHPDRVEKKRNVVLTAMLQDGKIDQTQFDIATSQPMQLGAVASQAGTLSYPSFMGFVRQNLRDGYKESDLQNDGLQIHTTLDPRIQSILERSVDTELAAIEKQRSMDVGSLQAAAVIMRTDNGEVVAMVGDRNSGYAGYNRALKSQRPVGSLLKPFVYLTALEAPERYSLASLVPDQAITVSQKGSPDWSPQNYDGLEHGPVLMVEALAQSYNLATVNLGMELGVDAVAQTLKRAGHNKPLNELPSLLLGATPMTVLDVGQLYLSLASNGFKTPVKSVRAVLSKENDPLARYALDIEQVFAPEHVYLINYALQDAIRNGTGQSVLNRFKYDYGLAGKTGTTNDYRDSWFAGFSGNYLMVVWVGRDDNKPTGLTGATGAARVWSRAMQQLPLQRLELGFSEQVIPQKVYYSENQEEQDCSMSRTLPVILVSLEAQNLSCSNHFDYELQPSEDEQRHFEPTDEEKPMERRPKKKSLWKRIFG